jgi:hypothetical protein
MAMPELRSVPAAHMGDKLPGNGRVRASHCDVQARAMVWQARRERRLRIALSVRTPPSGARKVRQRHGYSLAVWPLAASTFLPRPSVGKAIARYADREWVPSTVEDRAHPPQCTA